MITNLNNFQALHNQRGEIIAELQVWKMESLFLITYKFIIRNVINLSEIEKKKIYWTVFDPDHQCETRRDLSSEINFENWKLLVKFIDILIYKF